MSSETSETRTRILKASLHLLESSEGKGVRMTDIAKAAGISRQAVYLHFPSRAALLVATTHYLDDLSGAEDRLAPSRNAKTGAKRLDAFIEAWGSYIPEIHGIAKALMAMADTDAEAAEAWGTRMQDMREGCEAAIKALADDYVLTAEHSIEQATDILWTMLSIRTWEQLTLECGWSQALYIEKTQANARRLFITNT
jgi:AcrR family transcriptional regulator